MHPEPPELFLPANPARLAATVTAITERDASRAYA
jgi:hypothetical protein